MFASCGRVYLNNTSIYHYTSIATLALILKYKTIRFNNLMNVDDMEEASVEDFSEFGRFCFASCWTKDNFESIALWNLYTPNMGGVRIRLPQDLFSFYYNNGSCSNCFYSSDGYIGKTCKELEYLERNYGYSSSFEFIDVNYTDDEKKINTNLINRDGNGISFIPTEVGKYKKKQWEFQKESRFLLKVFPYTDDDIFMSPRLHTSHKFKEPIATITDLFAHIDLNIKPSAFNEMEILYSPKMIEADKIIIEALVNSHNPGIKIVNSNLRIRNKN